MAPSSPHNERDGTHPGWAEAETARAANPPQVTLAPGDTSAAHLAAFEQKNGSSSWGESVSGRRDSTENPDGSPEDLTTGCRRQIAAQRELLEQMLAGYPPQLRLLSQAAFGWLDRADQLCQKLDENRSELRRLRAEREALQQQFQRTQQKVELVGQTHSIGLLLRKQQASLPDPAHIRNQIRARQPEIQSVHLELFDLQDRQAEFKDLSSLIQNRMHQVGTPPETMSPEAWQEAIREVVLFEKAQLDRLLSILHRHFETLVELDGVQTELLQLAEQYRTYINERILWIRSTPVLGRESLRHGIIAAGWLLRWTHLEELVQGVWEGVQNDPLGVAGILTVVVLLGYTARRFRQRITQIGLQLQKEEFSQFLPTVQSIAMTLAVGMFRPAVLWLLPAAVGWTLSPTEFLRAIGETLRLIAWTLVPWELLLAVCQQHGLAEAHFGWPIRSVRALRGWLQIMAALALPWLLLAGLFHYQAEERFDSSLGRLGFMGLMAVWAIGWAWLIRFKGPFVQGLSSEGQRPCWLRFRFPLYWVGVLTPLGLAILAGAGYYYTAQQLAWRCYGSVAVVVAVGWLGAILRRGILILWQRTAMSRATTVAPQEPPAMQPPDAVVQSLSETPPPVPERSQITLQVERLLGVLLFLGAVLLVGVIWMDIWPALGMLERIPLWAISWQPGTEPVSGEPGGQTPAVSVRWVSAADMLWAAVVLLITYLGAKNLPALLELLLPEKLPLDQGARYALKTLVQYGVVLVGLLVGLPPLGITWNRMQWLVAALGVGLGFGLQEIFANFVSGLILLFERPIRVGDIVTVGDVSGVVSKIRIRATIITNWDRQDLIVPNKEFITGRVLNWTLTNLTNRIVLQVGVAYGTDPERVRRLLEEILQSHPLILRDPAPLVTLENFGDSSLQFTIRAYLPVLDKRLQTIHELYTAIHNRFQQEGIEIPFPQRHVHIRSWASPAQGGRVTESL
ncbi:MAG: mechanosensitive ion channel [Thermoguttaceae bacterium]|nr:mechanosensitive ion channel [Thermoguttaceae bacterium]MDW8038239.1 mechanosensitive ion channel [Thermoguttaceae bacterium]